MSVNSMKLFSLLKSYQYMIKLLKSPSTIFMILMLKTKPSCQSVNVNDKKVFRIFIMRNGLLLTTIKVSFNIILLIAFSSVHLCSLALSELKMSHTFVRLRQSPHRSQPLIRVYFLLVYAWTSCEHTSTALSRNQLSYVLIFYITNALFLYLQKDLLFLYTSLLYL